MGILGTAVDGRKRDRKKKPDELLSSVVRETAIPAAIELLRSNERFVFPSGTAYVMLVLAADDIGGLSKRHGRDEAKGSLIELIDSDQIKTLATAEMLEEEVFGIIPNAETLERMEEYSLLTGASYAWAVVWPKPGGELLVELAADATFVQAKGVSNGTLTLEEVVGEKAWAEHSGVAVVGNDTSALDSPAVAAAEDTTVAAEDGDDDGDDVLDPIPGDEDTSDFEDEPDFGGADDEPEFDDASFDEVEFDPEASTEVLPAADVETEAEPVAAEPEEDFDQTAGFAEYDEDSLEAGQAEDDEDVVLLTTQDEVKDVIARRFLSEDLDLSIRLDEFNATFAIGAPVVQIDVPVGVTEWLGDQIAQLNRQANADLAQLRFAHEDELRTLYVNLMSTHVEEVIRHVSTERDGSRYKALKETTEREHRERVSEKEQRIRESKTRIVADYEAQAKKVAEQAALAAEVQYKERNRPKMEREQADAVAEIDRVLENAHSHDQQEILRIRRADAELKMQIGASRIFEVLAERQMGFLKAEEELKRSWDEKIQRIVEDNRQADIVQANALTEQQRRVDEVGLLRQEQEQLLESIRSEHADRIRRLEEELDRSRQDAITAMRARDSEWQHSLDLEKEKTESATQRASDLLVQMETVENTIDRRYQKTIADLKSDRDQYSTAMDRANASYSRTTRLFIFYVIGAGVLCGLAGWVAGMAFGG